MDFGEVVKVTSHGRVEYVKGALLFPDSPAENAEDEVEHEEGAEDDEGEEEHPVRGAPLGVVGLRREARQTTT